MTPLTCSQCGARNRAAQVPTGQVPVCARCGAALPWLHEGTDDSLDTDIQAAVPVIVDFWAPWCGPCRVLGPVLEELARERAGRVRVVKVNVDEHGRHASALGVQGIPTLLLYRQGRLAGRLVGAQPKAALLNWLDQA
ncbi:thioredoxin [Deinococcus multiflagellatus]|uniref:Thioredoxin n=1 Tax=Deinococcus multiflagellatus TaxID=1656887 RepID=A0ABW1ZU32_9DEIO|nr:thioredoxin [Deinococcus multiflagellatus]MBZ9715896.1 thioredoxin [Deinococcus multiflagellatus]